MKSRIKDNICPHCMSKLIDNNGVMDCTGNLLTVWITDFKRYEQMNSTEKRDFLVSFSDSEKFVELFDSWSRVDSNGNKSNLSCGYTSKIFSTLPDNRIMMADPIQTKRVEKLLGRNLTEKELTGDSSIRVGEEEINLEMMVFPDDF